MEGILSVESLFYTSPRNKPPVLQSPARWSRQFNDFIAKWVQEMDRQEH